MQLIQQHNHKTHQIGIDVYRPVREAGRYALP